MGVIYRIENVATGGFYVGSAVNHRRRKWEHWASLKKGTHHCAALQKAWNEFGEDAFEFVVMEEIPDDDLLHVEDTYLLSNATVPDCYNTALSTLTSVASQPDVRAKISATLKEIYAANPGQHPRVGKKHTDESKGKISAKVQRALAEGRGGKFIPSEETRLRMSQALRGNQNAKGHIRTEEHRRKLSEANRGNTNFKGKRHTEETKEKIRKRVRVEPDGKVYGSLTAVLEHYGLKMPSLRRALLSGKPLSKGPLKGYSFFYA